MNPSTQTPPSSSIPRLDVGLPDFPAITLPQLREAVLAAMSQQRELWEAIATDTEPATVENTLLPLETARGALRHSYWTLHTLASSAADDDIRAVETELAPLMAAHKDALYLDRRIFDRLTTLRDGLAAASSADDETAWLLHSLPATASVRRLPTSAPVPATAFVRAVEA